MEPERKDAKPEAEIARLDAMIEDLRKKYELYFSGMEKREPSMERMTVEGLARRLHSTLIFNTGLVYRLKSVATRLTSYQAYWDRTLRQMEEGTFRRELDKRKLIQQDWAVKREAERLGEGYIGMHEYLDGDLDDELHRAAMDALGNEPAENQPEAPPDAIERLETPEPASFTPVPLPAASSAPAYPVPPAPYNPPSTGITARPKGGGMTESRVKEIYEAFMSARRAVGENTNLSLEGFRRQIESQLPNLREKFRTENIDFKVSIKGGKALLKAVTEGQ
jgi:hypothetical protein